MMGEMRAQAMPSPFPGMDPYLESPSWMSVHSQLVAEIARQLAPKLRPRYLALATERFVVESPDDVAVATIPRTAVEIRDVSQRQLVTAIEVLSPTNKRGDGRAEYLPKRRHILMSSAHLIEFDLLRQGQRVHMLQSLPPVPYYAFVSRSEKRPMMYLWTIRLQDSLPVIPVPLLPGDADVELDLQLALTTIYDLLGFDLAFDYTQPPVIPLAGDEAAWAEQLLRKRRRDDDPD